MEARYVREYVWDVMMRMYREKDLRFFYSKSFKWLGSETFKATVYNDDIAHALLNSGLVELERATDSFDVYRLKPNVQPPISTYVKRLLKMLRKGARLVWDSRGEYDDNGNYRQDTHYLEVGETRHNISEKTWERLLDCVTLDSTVEFEFQDDAGRDIRVMVQHGDD